MKSDDTRSLWRRYRRASAVGQFDSAHSIALRGARLWEGRGDAKLAGIWYRQVSNALFCAGRYAEATIEAERSSDIQPDRYERALSLYCIARDQLNQYKLDSAAVVIDLVLNVAGEFSTDNYLWAHVRGVQAMLLMRKGDIDSSIVVIKQAVDLLKSGGLSSKAAVFMNTEGYYLALASQPARAEHSLLAALDVFKKTPSRYCEADTKDSLGYVYTLLGKHQDAENLLRGCTREFEQMRNKSGLAGSLLNLSHLYDRMGRRRKARKEAARALEIATEINYNHLRTQANEQLLKIEIIRTRLEGPVFRFHELVYASSAMQSLVNRLKIAAITNEVILIQGDTGTGKELLAQAIHKESKRRNGPFIPFNCSSVSRELIESRLFGHCKGAFTSADSHNDGVIRAASRGTLLLDEIGDLSLEAQGALLRFLQSGEIQPVGSSKPVKVDARVIAATNRDLREDLETGRFRRDLFHRLNVVTLWVPPLRLRTDDIRVLVRHFSKKCSEQFEMPDPLIGEEEMRELMGRDWTGNARELENYIKRRVLFGRDAEDLSEPPGFATQGSGHELRKRFPTQGSQADWRDLNSQEKRDRLEWALEACGGNVTLAAKRLRISRRTVQRLRKLLGTEEADAL